MFTLSGLRTLGAPAEETLACIREAPTDATASLARDDQVRRWLREALPTPIDYWLARFLLKYGRELSFFKGLEGLIRLVGEPHVPARSVVWFLIRQSGEIGVVEAGEPPADQLRPFQTDILVDEMLRDRLNREAYVQVRRFLDTGLIGTRETEYVYDVRQLGDPSEVYQLQHPGAGPLSQSAWPAGWRWQPVVRTGRAAYDLELLRSQARVLVRIRFVWRPINQGPPRSVSSDTRSFDEAKEEALHAIRSSWDNKFWLDNGTLRIPIRVQVEETDGDPHHTVSLWAGQVPQSGTPDVGNWYADDSRGITLGFTAVHEFGHFLGNVDEQNLSAEEYERIIGSAPSATNPKVTVAESDRAGGYRYTARGSVMGFTYRELSLQQVGEAQAAPVLARHFTGVQATANAILPPGVDRFEVVGSPPA